MSINVFIRFAQYLGVSIVFISCATVVVPSNSTNEIWRFGVVRIKGSDDSSKISKSDLSSIGFWVGKKGVGLGYKKTTLLQIGDKCQVVFLVKSDDQLNKIKNLLKEDLKKYGEVLCAEIN